MSDKAIAEKLRVTVGRTLAVLGANAMVDAAIGGQRAEAAAADMVLLCVPDRAALDAHLPATLRAIRPDAIFWLAYPKLTSPLAADLNRDVIHALSPAFGLDTVSQIAIDADWSAMRLKRI